MQQGGGGTPFGGPLPPELSPFSPTSGGRAQMLGAAADHLGHPEAAPPISARPPPPPPSGPGGFDELGPDDGLGAGEEGERGGASGGNRWPRQETLALLKIRSDMDAAFRDATLKGPLWDEVSRKLAELGYTRSAKKCKEKFENVHKYYKRTKEGRAGRQDGKSYRFFTQLEALHNTATTTSPLALPTTTAAPPTSMLPTSSTATNPPPPSMAPRIQPPPLSSAPLSAPPPISSSAAGISFSSNTSSSSASESDDDDDEATEEGPSREGTGTGGSRKRKHSSGGGTRKMMAFFEGLMRQVIERQEAMQQRFLEAIEKREQDRMIREEAWRRQEMARLAREQDIVNQERAAAASRDAAVISFLQKVTGQTVPLPSPPPSSSAPPHPPPPPPVVVSAPAPIQQQQQPQTKPPTQPQLPPQSQHHHQHQPQPLPPPSSSSELVPAAAASEQPPPPHESSMAVVGSGSTDPASSRWPKSEVHALIKLRSGLDSRYQESGPKGPLWEEISAGMQRMGYNRSAKRCKEKWENINKYFKKVKESNKKRPEDAKTCPYFHQLDALYRNKALGSAAGGSAQHRPQEHDTATAAPNPSVTQANALTIMPPPQLAEVETKTGNTTTNTPNNSSKNRNGGNGEGGGVPSNGGLTSPPSFFEEGPSTGSGSATIAKKPEDIVKELMGQQSSGDYDKLEKPDSDNMDDDDLDDEDDDDVDDDDDDEDRKTQYRIQFQRPNNVGGGGGSGAPNGGGKASAAGSFLALVR